MTQVRDTTDGGSHPNGGTEGNYWRNLTPQQRRIQNAAMDLHDLLDKVIPSNVTHYAVEEARSALRTLLQQLSTVMTEDHPNRKA